MKKRSIPVLLALSCALSLSVSARAAELSTVHVAMNSSNIYVEGVKAILLSSCEEKAGEVGALFYENMTYVPLETVGPVNTGFPPLKSPQKTPHFGIIYHIYPISSSSRIFHTYLLLCNFKITYFSDTSLELNMKTNFTGVVV